MLSQTLFSFRKKTLLIHIFLLIVLLVLFFSFVEKVVDRITVYSLKNRANELIGKIQKAPDFDSLIAFLHKEKTLTFFRVTLFDHEGDFIYDTHFQIKNDFDRQEIDKESRLEIYQALKYGQGYSEGHSTIFKETLINIALPFSAHGQDYVLRIGFPYKEIRALSHQLEWGFTILSSLILLIYGFLSLSVIYRMSRPIQQIIQAIRPYQDGREEFIPRIELIKEMKSKTEFGKLAQTFNALNERIQKQIAHLVEQRERTKEILDSLGEGVIAIDIDHSITFANRAACNMLGASCDELLGHNIGSIQANRNEMVAKCQELFEHALEKSETVVQTFTVIDTQKLYYDLIAAPLALHNGIVLVLQDKTSDYEVIEMGKDFISNASHELRTPITIIRGFAETLHDLPELTKAQTKEIIEKIFKTSIRLEGLVKSLLTLADIENLKEDQFQMTDLMEIVNNCKQLLLAAHPNVNISIQQKIDRAPVWGDVDLFGMAIMNLFENAVKYSPSPHQIDVMLDQVESSLQLSIQDRGIGIPVADQPRIFDRFYTVDKARSRKFGGTGLGLSIVKTIVQKHHGDIFVVSKLGQGSTFTIHLPLAKD